MYPRDLPAVEIHLIIMHVTMFFSGDVFIIVRMHGCKKLTQFVPEGKNAGHIDYSAEIREKQTFSF
jgi:hypothetical protein